MGNTLQEVYHQLHSLRSLHHSTQHSKDRWYFQEVDNAEEAADPDDAILWPVVVARKCPADQRRLTTADRSFESCPHDCATSWTIV